MQNRGVITPPLLLPWHRSRAGSPDSDGGKRPRACRSARRCARPGRIARSPGSNALVWFAEEAIAAWHAEPGTTPGGQPHYSALAITTALTLKAVLRLA